MSGWFWEPQHCITNSTPSLRTLQTHSYFENIFSFMVEAMSLSRTWFTMNKWVQCWRLTRPGVEPIWVPWALSTSRASTCRFWCWRPVPQNLFLLQYQGGLNVEMFPLYCLLLFACDVHVIFFSCNFYSSYVTMMCCISLQCTIDCREWTAPCAFVASHAGKTGELRVETRNQG